jgi:hypothetical protein
VIGGDIMFEINISLESLISNANYLIEEENSYDEDNYDIDED